MTTAVSQVTYRHQPNRGADGIATSGGIREDLSDIIYDLSPTETPVLSFIGSAGSVTNTYSEWLQDELATPKNNAVPEGHIAQPNVAKPRSRIGNYTQILEKTASVSGTQENGVTQAGVKSEMAYQVARRMKEIKMDLEVILVGVDNTSGLELPQAMSPGSSTNGSTEVAKPSNPAATQAEKPRKMGSFVTYMNDKTYFPNATGSTAPTGDGKTKPVAGAARQFNQGILTSALEQMWLNGSTENLSAFMGAQIRSSFSGLVNTATRYVTMSDKNLQTSIDVFDGDFHTVTAKPDRWCDPSAIFLIDPAYAGMADLRPIFSKDLAVTGDAMNKQIIWETTLKVSSPLAHGVIAALKK